MDKTILFIYNIYSLLIFNCKGDLFMKRFITPLLLSVTLILPLFSLEATAQTRTEVYTKFVQGNFNHSGDGSAESPYNLFVDAMDAVADGGTIYIMDGGAFINDTSDEIPFAINKNVTISSLPGASVYPTLNVRKPGIALGSDVTFKNIELSFSNPTRPVVCANGYNLVMDNVFYSKSARKIHLAGGGMYSGAGVSISPKAGEHGSITVKGSKSMFGNIYAGSINGNFNNPVNITVCDVASSNIGNIYASGAKEGYYDSNNIFDVNNEPEDPSANPALYPVLGNVLINLNKTGAKEVYGKTGGNTNAAISVSTQYLYSCSLQDIVSLEVKSGHFSPENMNKGADVIVHNGAIFDISQLDTNFEVNNFEGGGIIMVSNSGCLNIIGQCSGETELKITGGSSAYSGIAQYNHMYVKTESEGTFILNPYPTQSDMKLEKHDGGWWTSQKLKDTVSLKSFDIADKIIYTSTADINGYTDNTPIIQTTAEFTESSKFEYIGMIPFEYSVTYKGKKFTIPSTPLTEFDGYYEGDIEELNMNFAPIESEIMISNISSSLELGEIAEGIYDIEITAPTVTGNVTHSLVLIVRDTVPETREQFDVTFENGKADVIFTNTNEKQIDNAVMMICLYDNNGLKFLKPADDKISLKSGETQVVHFDIDGIDYNKLKIMVWDSLETMTPICDYYEKK